MAFFPTSVLDQAVLNEQIKALFAPKTASGSIASFSDGGDDIPVSEYECEIVATGFTQADITVCGKNFYPIKVGRDLFTDNRSATHSTNDDILSITMDSQNNSGVYGGTGTAIGNQICQTIKQFSGDFVLSLYAKASADNKDVFFGFTSFYFTVETLTTAWKKIELPMTLDNNIHTLNFYNRSGSAITVDIKDVQIEVGSQASEYVSYTSSTYTVSFGTTINSGKLKYSNGAWYLDDLGTITPITSSTRVKTISGVNNIYSNTGDNSVKYFTENADSLAELIKAFVV